MPATALTTRFKLLLSSASALVALTLPLDVAADDLWQPHVETEMRASTIRRLGELEFFFPVWQDATNLTFVNLRGMGDSEDSIEGNAGFGYRRMMGNGWNLGAYGFFDYRHSPENNAFTQFTLGVEALGADFDFRGNVYLPFGDTVQDAARHSSVSEQGGSLQIRAGEERAMTGFDGEIGWRLPVFDLEDETQVRFYAGGYYFDEAKSDTVAGPRARLEADIYDLGWFGPGSRLAFEAQTQYDDVRGHEHAGVIRFRLPLGWMTTQKYRKLDAQERRMTDSVIRDIDVVSAAGDFGAPEAAIIEANGVQVSKLVRVDADAADLNAQVAAAGANSLVILNGANGAAQTATSVNLSPGQTLMSAGTGITVRGASSKTSLTYNAGGTRAAINNTTTTTDAVVLAERSLLSGVDVSGGRYAIQGMNAHHARIEDVTITGTDDSGIYLVDSDHVSISRTKLHHLRDDGSTFEINDPDVAVASAIYARNSHHLSVSDVSVDTANYGLFLRASEDATVRNLHIANTTNEGTYVSQAHGLDVDGLWIDSAKFDSLVVSSTQNARFNETHLSNGRFNGFMLVSPGVFDTPIDNVTFTNSSAVNMGLAGIFLNPTQNATFSNMKLINSGTNGITFYGSTWEGPVADIRFDNLLIDGVNGRGWGGNALYFMGPTEDITGTVTVTGTDDPVGCMVWGGGGLDQPKGGTLKVNGTVLTSADVQTRC